jgi:LPS-assembly protein
MALRPLALVLSVAALLGSASPGGLMAQEAATLIADRLEIAADSKLIAEGAVEVFYQGRRMTAQRIIFDQATDQLRIEGPIRLTDAEGSTVIVAAQADLSSDLTEGILQSARVVLNQQLQMASAQMVRSEGRYLQLDNAVASSCKICAGSSTPLWEIRAQRVLHDQEEQQIYFDHAQLRFGGMPVLYIPRLRIPDPTLDRSNGFLMPRFTNRTDLGTGLTLPYFLTIGPSRDLTFSPTITTNGAQSLEVRYRQAFETGNISVTGTLSRDDIQPNDTRGYIVADGVFRLPRGYRLAFHGEAVSDDAYLADYGISDTDRLTNTIQVDRVRRDEYIAARIINFDTLRDGDFPSATPYLVTDSTYIQRFQLGSLGGEGTLRFGTHTHTRQSSNALDGLDPDDIAEGADMQRLSIGADWRKDWVTGNGMVLAALGEVRLDTFNITDDATYSGGKSRLYGAGAVELRWPWVRAGADGVAQVIEPVAQLAWSDDNGNLIPNEDSRLVEFDEANLFSLNRFPGVDVVESGLRANLGVSWTRIDPTGWSMGITAGRVFRDAPAIGFSTASGLSGSTSDWLLAVTAETPGGLDVAGRIIADDDLSITRGEVLAEYGSPDVWFNTGYIWSIADLAESRPSRVSDLVLGGGYQISPGWQATASGRYDFEADSYRSADFGVSFKNECLLVDLSLSRRFTSSTTVRPGTTVDLSVELLGFGGGTEAGPARMCRR